MSSLPVTAIEWLQTVYVSTKELTEQDFQQANEMFKKQIIEAAMYGNEHPLMASPKIFAEHYYRKTYKNHETNSNKAPNR